MNPAILMMGMNHISAPIQVRERVAFSTCTQKEALDHLHRAMTAATFSESLLLSTCNRTEVYVVSSDIEGAENTLRGLFLGHEAFLSAGTEYLRTHSDRHAVAHLFAVASGIESMIVGESEILGQVRSAYLLAAENDTTGPVLHQLFKSAIHTGKRAHSETAIGAGAVSVAHAAVAMARQHLRGLKPRKALVVGAGAMGRRAAKTLALEGASTVMVTNRTHAEALELASGIGGRAVQFQELGQALSDADLVISATAAPHLVIDVGMVEQALRERPDRPLYMIDIAVPRDIDPSVARLPGVHLYNVDDLKQHIEDNRALRELAIDQVKAIIAEQVERFWRWHVARRAAPVLADLNERAEAIRAAELEKALRRLGHLRLSPRDRNVIAALSSGIVSRLLAGPTTQLKERVQSGDGQQYLNTLRELFELDSNEKRNLPPSL